MREVGRLWGWPRRPAPIRETSDRAAHAVGENPLGNVLPLRARP